MKSVSPEPHLSNMYFSQNTKCNSCHPTSGDNSSLARFKVCYELENLFISWLCSIPNSSTREYYATKIHETRIKSAPHHDSVDWYMENESPILKRVLGATLVRQLRFPSLKGSTNGTHHVRGRLLDDLSEQGAGEYVVLHLRFDKVGKFS